MRQRNIPPRAPGAYLPFPLWLRFTVSGTIAVLLLVAMVIFIDGHNTNTPTLTNATTAATANREAEVLIAQDQVPHTVRLRPGATPLPAVLHVVRRYISRQITRGAISGPLQHATCQPAGSRGATRRAFGCTVQSASVEYHFLAAVDLNSGQIAYCKHDPPPAPTDVVPVSPRCLA